MTEQETNNSISQGDNSRAANKDYIENQYNNNIVKESLSNPLISKMLNDFYDVRLALINFTIFLSMFFFFIASSISIYMLKHNYNFDAFFHLLGAYILSLFILGIYYFLNKRIELEEKSFMKEHKFTVLLILDLVIWYLIIYLNI
ncbi:MAG: hypothetical protein COB42_00430 [Sulfurimonas sp.]|nr:MAG: hypothetical protein COB42_00430 [Sulfurimonas sp.]